MSPRNPEQNEQMRQEAIAAILDAAARLFAERGFHAASMSAIAREAGVSKGLPYNYFDGKDDILEAIIDRRLDEVLSVIDSIDADAPAAERLRELVEASLQHARDNVETYRFYISTFLRPQTSPAIHAAASRHADRFAQMDQFVIDIFTELGFDEPVTEARFLRATLNGLIQELVMLPEAFDFEAMKRRLLANYPQP
jgi:AcrR family transcriptional regulator